MTSENPYASATLYVGDLSPEVTEATLFEVFNAIGPVASIRVCRDVSTRTSLGYAYVNFHSVTSAERALEALNYCKIKGRPCRIMWSQRDKQLRESGKGNIFVKNLHESIDNKTLQDTFRVFGPILSCTVVIDPETGASRGYGYVHFLQPEHAKKAIEELKGKWIAGKQIHAERFVPRQERLKQTLWTNVYFKHIPAKMTEEDLKKFVEEKTGGKITCSHMWEKPTFGKSSCLNFESHEMAAKCVETLNKYDMKDWTDEKENESKPVRLYVARSQKRSERDRILKKNARRPRTRPFTSPSNNLYVKPLGSHVTDERLRELFSPFGSIVSAKVMTSNDGQSRGFGFVCFHNPENAAQALAKLHGSVIDGTKMYVSRAQKKEDRQQYLANRGRRPPSRRYGYGNAPSSQTPFHNAPQMGGYYSYPRPGMPSQAQMHAAQFNQGQMPRQPYPFNPMGQMPMQMPMAQMGMPMTQMGMPMNMNFGGFAGMRPPNAGFGGIQQPHAGMQVHPQPSNSAAVAGGIPGSAAMRGGMGSVGVISQSGIGMGGIRGPQAGVSAMSAGTGVGTGVSTMGVPMTNYSQPAQAATTAPAQHNIYPSAGQTGIEPSGGQSRPIQSFPSQLSATERETQPLTLQMLQGATGQERKRMIGERLFPKIQEVEPRLAGKITGMLLEMENTELLVLLTNKEQLRKKINEALSVLKEHTKKQSLRNSESRGGSQSNQSASNRQASAKT